MIRAVAEFARYFDGVRRRTWTAVDRVTPELLGWAPRAGEFACGDIVRHLAGAERFFVTKVLEDRWTEDLAPGTVKAWRFLMAMAEHEIHHRSQLDSHLSMAEVEPPRLYGWRMEDVVDLVGSERRQPR